MYFAKRLPPLGIDVISTYKEKYEAEYGPLGVPLSHQPSEPVVIFVNQEFVRLGLEAAGVDAKEARQLAKRSTFEERKAYVEENLGITNYTEYQVPWLLKQTPYNNVSAGASIIAMIEMIEDGTLQSGVATPVFGFGIGSVIQVDVWRFNVDA